MPEILNISTKQARRLAIIHQGLHTSSAFGPGKKGVMRAIDQIGYVQIDTISVVERAHHHVIRTRVPNYKQKHLHDLQFKDRKVLEFWSHAAAYVPMSDYRFMLPIVDHFKSGRDPWPKGDKKVMKYVLNRIKNEGPLMSRDFEAAKNPKGDGWWEWKPAKLALQRLFFEGDLQVSHRKGFQRIYDLTEHIVPAQVDVSKPTRNEYADFLIDHHLKAHAFGTGPMISYLRWGMAAPIKKRLEERCEDGGLMRIVIRGIEKSELYAKPDVLNAASTRISRQLKILSPFDNAVIQRERLSVLFGYDYLIECYVPKSKRVYGYFVLPLLLGDRFVGRLDAKADRKLNVLNIISLHFENGVDEDECIRKLGPALAEFCLVNGCESIQVQGSVNTQLKKELERTI